MNVSYTIDPLFDFQIICDIDLGLYRLIKRDYYDRSVFDNYLFDSNDEDFIKTMLLVRKDINPLSIFCKKDKLSEEEKENIYQEFLDTEYDNILNLSTPTTIMKIASISNNTNNIVNVKILCRNKKEVEWVKKYNRKLKCIIDKYEDLDISKYDTIYIKDINNLLLFKQEPIIEKNIIFANYVFNLEDQSGKLEVPKLNVVENYYRTNKFIAIGTYKDIYMPVSEMEDLENDRN